MGREDTDNSAKVSSVPSYQQEERDCQDETDRTVQGNPCPFRILIIIVTLRVRVPYHMVCVIAFERPACKIAGRGGQPCTCIGIEHMLPEGTFLYNLQTEIEMDHLEVLASLASSS